MWARVWRKIHLIFRGLCMLDFENMAKILKRPGQVFKNVGKKCNFNYNFNQIFGFKTVGKNKTPYNFIAHFIQSKVSTRNL